MSQIPYGQIIKENPRFVVSKTLCLNFTWGSVQGRTDGPGRFWTTVQRFASIFTNKNDVFFCRFASGGSASTDFYSSEKRRPQKNTWSLDFSKPANAQVPISIDLNTIFEHLRGSPGSRGNGIRTAARNPPTTCRGSGWRKYKKLPQTSGNKRG